MERFLLKFYFLIFATLFWTLPSSAETKACSALFVKQEVATNLDYVGYGAEAQKVRFSGAHTLDLPHYVLRNLGTRIDLLLTTYDRFLILVGEPSDYRRILEREGVSSVKPVKKSYGTHKLSEGIDIHGQKVLMISNLMVSEQVLRSQLLFKAARVPEARIKTFGELRSLKQVYAESLKKMGPSPHIVVYGFSGTLINQILKLNSKLSLSRFKFLLAMYKKRNLAQRRNEWHEPFYSLQLSNGTKIWFLTNVYGEHAKFLFEALSENFSPKAVIAIGTAGALQADLGVGQMFTPKNIVLEDGTSYAPDLQPLRSSLATGAYSRVQTPLVETQDWFQSVHTQGVDVVDVELGHIMDVHQKKPSFPLKAAFLISDRISLNNQENDLSKWNVQTLTDSAQTVFNFIKTETQLTTDESWSVDSLQVFYKDPGEK